MQPFMHADDGPFVLATEVQGTLEQLSKKFADADKLLMLLKMEVQQKHNQEFLPPPLTEPDCQPSVETDWMSSLSTSDDEEITPLSMNATPPSSPLPMFEDSKHQSLEEYYNDEIDFVQQSNSDLYKLVPEDDCSMPDASFLSDIE